MELFFKVLFLGKCLFFNKKIVYVFLLFCFYELVLDVFLNGGLVLVFIDYLNRIIFDIFFRNKCDDYDEEFLD